MIFVVTALDRLRRQSERDTVLQTVTERIKERTREHAVERFGEGTEAFNEYLRRVGEPRVFGVSGYDALAAKVEGDEALLSESRFPDFESFLERFLTEESGLVALKTHAERLAGFADALRREVSARLQAPSPASDPIMQTSLEALLRSLEWLAQDARSRIDEHRRDAQSEVRHSLQTLPQDLRQAADLCLVEMSPPAEDLEPPRASVFVKSWRDKLTGTVKSASEAKARTLVAQVRTRMSAAAETILRFGTTFDRVIGHVRAAPGFHERARAGPRGRGRSSSVSAARADSKTRRLGKPWWRRCSTPAPISGIRHFPRLSSGHLRGGPTSTSSPWRRPVPSSRGKRWTCCGPKSSRWISRAR